MRIYLITHDEYEYDAVMGRVVVSNTKKEAIAMCKDGSCDEGKAVWDNAKVTILGRYSGKKTKPFIALTDFNAG